MDLDGLGFGVQGPVASFRLAAWAFSRTSGMQDIAYDRPW